MEIKSLHFDFKTLVGSLALTDKGVDRTVTFQPEYIVWGMDSDDIEVYNFAKPLIDSFTNYLETFYDEYNNLRKQKGVLNDDIFI